MLEIAEREPNGTSVKAVPIISVYLFMLFVGAVALQGRFVNRGRWLGNGVAASASARSKFCRG